MIKPNLILKKNGNEFIIDKPEEHKDRRVKLFNRTPVKLADQFKEKYRPINFLDIEEIVKIIPEIKDSINFKLN